MSKILEYIEKIRPKVMWEVARLAWEDDLENRVEELPDRIVAEARAAGWTTPEDQRQVVEQQIRLAMGLSPREEGTTLSQAVNYSYQEKGQQLPLVSHVEGLCQSCPEESNQACSSVCPQGAIKVGADGKKTIDGEKCDACGICITTCPTCSLADKVQFVPLIKLLKNKEEPVYAAVAPAFAGQFGEDVKAGQVRAALKRIGFKDMVEVALFADILSIKEAYEFDHLVKKEKDFMLTSCCCPVWINMIEKKFPQLLEKISPSVSPMIASGRVLKVLHPQAKVVFIGPCIAKKKEAIHPELQGAIDFVLTFKELKIIFDAAGINLEEMPDDFDHQSSWGGRAYGRTGGVSASIALVLETIAPDRAIKVNSKRVDGARACQEILEKASRGDLDVNFIEGMGCKGGCIGGPGRLVDDLFEATLRVNEYSYQARMKIPLNNPTIYQTLKNLGLNYKTPKVIAVNPLADALTRELTRK